MIETPHTKLATQTSILLTPFLPPSTPFKLVSHASLAANTTALSLSSPTTLLTSSSNPPSRQAATSQLPSNNPTPATTYSSLSTFHPASTANSVSLFGPNT
ncbi:hypothetical protein ABHI18_012590, partial [Aspergillus niger]